MIEPVWLNRKDCLAIHEMMLSHHGGLAGVRDEGLLISALTKSQNLVASGAPRLAELAAAYAVGRETPASILKPILKDHPNCVSEASAVIREFIDPMEATGHQGWIVEAF